MSTCRTRKQTEKPSAPAVGEDEPIPGLTSGELMDPPPQASVDPQQSTKVSATEHPSEPSVRAHGPQTVPARIQSPIGVVGAAGLLCPVNAYHSGHNLGGAPDKSDSASPHEGGMENEDGSFTIKASELGQLRKEYADIMNLKENGEIIGTSMNSMSPTMKNIFLVPHQKSSGKTIKPGNNRARDKAAVKAATKRIVAQGATSVPITGT
ncbi:hypothetical protein M422DRAFT_272698 [Sphaerobolus stellatus SS14]|uniref:Uncharacterized protein n=1 Tax=Sphaerobolus stellatus (strain SS14) TaxID=990650 RepID=A0A0C9ULV1_SPHS4|nr:hypothetical protein M422DRAFT_272698 [Sphaerobolus stellatus SS14]